MHRKIAAAIAALVLFAGPSTVSFAQNPSGTPTGTNPTAEGIGNTSSTHNPRPQSSGPTGMENRKTTGGDVGTDTSTHNPSEILHHIIRSKNVEALTRPGCHANRRVPPKWKAK
jgi:hypothetical protein